MKISNAHLQAFAGSAKTSDQRDDIQLLHTLYAYTHLQSQLSCRGNDQCARTMNSITAIASTANTTTRRVKYDSFGVIRVQDRHGHDGSDGEKKVYAGHKKYNQRKALDAHERISRPVVPVL